MTHTLGDKQELIRTTIEGAAESSDKVLKHIGLNKEVYCRVAMNAVLASPNILNCEPKTLRKALMQCAQIGLLPDGDAATLVPFKLKGVLTATLIIGYKGMIDLARRSIPGIVIDTHVVTDEDEFEYALGLHPVLTHKRLPTGKRPTEKNIIAAYAVAHMPKNPNHPEFELLFRSELDHIRNTYTQAKSKLWIEEYAEACKKTALRRLGKRLPIRSGLLIQGLEPEGDPIEDFETGEVIDIEAKQDTETKQASKTRTSARTARAAKTKPANPDPEPQPPDDDDDDGNGNGNGNGKPEEEPDF